MLEPHPLQLRTTDEYSQHERHLVRRIAELTEEVEHLRASTSQVCIYFFSIIGVLKARVNHVFFPFPAFD